MRQFEDEARAFRKAKTEEEEEARQRVALSLLCGVDIADVFAASPDRRARLIRQIERLIERERLKGMKRHWSYDLNRHIALKQVLDRLCGRVAKRAVPYAERQELNARRRAYKRKRRPWAPS